MTDDTHFEMSWNADGISITEWADWDTDGQEPTVEEEWWFTWTEVFAELTGIEGVGPDIV